MSFCRNFVLQFDPAQIDELALRYGPQDDVEAFEAGRNIRNGDYSRENLKVIVRWKSARRVALIDDNSEDLVRRCLKFVSDEKCDEQQAVQTLDTLAGIGIPMASAILTAIHHEKYTVIDFRALESLGVTEWPNDSVDFYLAYLRACRELAKRYNKSLRTLDRALWRWSKEHGKAEAACV